ncbi:hypothetical protein KHA80_02900 [Anaerobacillus sp. HL2]|nr:hypothetical protein KHA80_02900 [Anaerobacillus sp. HL2]
MMSVGQTTKVILFERTVHPEAIDKTNASCHLIVVEIGYGIFKSMKVITIL